jgi:hypothetical protein
MHTNLASALPQASPFLITVAIGEYAETWRRRDHPPHSTTVLLTCASGQTYESSVTRPIPGAGMGSWGMFAVRPGD